MSSSDATLEPAQGRLDRWPGLVSVLAAGGLFGLFQAAFLLSNSQNFPGGFEMVQGFARLGLISGMLTWLLLTPLVLLLRWLHPAWRRGEKWWATWSVCVGLAAALVVWMSTQAWFLGPWFAAGAALVAGVLASFVQLPRRWLKAAALVFLALTVLALLPIGPGFSSAPTSAENPTPAAADSTSPDVVLISVDTLRADRLGAYGRSPTLTPEMDRLASEGVVFARTLASSPWTLPSVASMLTGLSSLDHGAGAPLSSGLTFLRSPLEARFTTLAERFAAAGYRTRAVVSNPFLSVEMGMAQGFEQFETPFATALGAIFMTDLPLGRLLLTLFPLEGWADFRAEGLTARALEWIEEEDPAPLFLWVHYIDPHSPYRADPADIDLSTMIEEARQIPPPVLEDGTVVGESFAATSFVRAGLIWMSPEDRRRIEDYYDRSVRYLDRQLGSLFQALRQRSGGREVVLALTADHGEEFWDHGQFEHGHDYYREVTEIPLIFWGPERIPAGRRVESPVGLVDVGPTLLAAAGLPVPPPEQPDQGRSLERLWRNPAGGAEDLDPPRTSGRNLYGLPAVLLEQGPWRYILRANGVQELYDVTRDPAERHNLAAEEAELAGLFRQLLEPRLAYYLGSSEQPVQPISEETLRALRSLGYVR